MLAAGGLLLYFGAEWLVRGAAGLALALGIAPLVIGLTVVSYGTSAPELAVSLLAALEGRSAIALGNVIGSNIANIGLILGLTALIAPPRSDGSMARREVPILLAASVALPFVLLDGNIGRIDGVVFTIGAAVFTYVTWRWSRGHDKPHEELPTAGGNKLSLGVLVLVGLVALTGGGKVFVSGAAGLARDLGMSERVVGLTIVAIGTSLPELAASMVAALRGHSELALGNVVGSNIFNILLILGVTSIVTPISGALSAIRFDLAVMFAFSMLCAISLRSTRRIGRTEGVVYTASYVGFLGLLAALS
jgi:cation:H+ antiporter